MSKRPTRSIAPIAELLESEGWSPYLSQCIKRYARRNLTITDTQHMKAPKWIGQLSEEQRKELGLFTGTINKACFDAGLRMGLMTLVESLDRRDVYCAACGVVPVLRAEEDV